MLHIEVATTIMRSIWRKVQSLGLADVYRSNGPTLKQFVQKMAAIAFCLRGSTNPTGR